MARDASGWIEELLIDAAIAPAPGPIEGSDVLHYSATLGRRVRSDATWADAAVATYTKAQDAIKAGDWTRAAEYVDFFVDEASVIFGVFRGLIPDAISFLEAKGITRPQLLELNRRLLDLIHLPDGLRGAAPLGGSPGRGPRVPQGLWRGRRAAGTGQPGRAEGDLAADPGSRRGSPVRIAQRGGRLLG